MKKHYLLLFLAVLVQTVWAQKKNNPYNLPLLSSLDSLLGLAQKDSNQNLVEIKQYVPDVVLDLKYATKDNFLKKKLYKKGYAFVRLPVAQALAKAQAEFAEHGVGIKVFDAYRPYAVTRKMFEIRPDTIFLAVPWRGSQHNRGCAVDISLIDLMSGKEIAMPTGFDDFTEKAYANYPNLPKELIEHRELLKDVMQKAGFKVYEAEWWHFTYKDWEQYGLVDIDLEKLAQSKKSKK